MQRLVTTRHPSQIRNIVRRNEFHLAIDELIELVDRSRLRGMSPPTDKLRRVVYDRPSDIPSMLASTASAHASSNQPRPDPVVSNASAVEQSATSPEEHKADAVRHDDAQDQDEELPANVPPPLDEGDDEDDEASTAEDPGTSPADSASYTEDEIARVRKAIFIHLERVARRTRARTFGPPRELRILGDQHFKPFLTQSEHISWLGLLRGFYRKLYLGPVPHVVAALDYVLEYLRGQRRASTKRLVDKDGDHLDLEEIDADIRRWK